MLNDCKDMCSEAVGSRSGSFNSSARCNVTGYLIHHTEGGIAFCPEGCTASSGSGSEKTASSGSGSEMTASSGSGSEKTAGTNSVCPPPCCLKPWFWPDGSIDDPKAWDVSSDQYKCLSQSKKVKNKNRDFAEFAEFAEFAKDAPDRRRRLLQQGDCRS